MRKKYLQHIIVFLLLYCAFPAFVQGQNAYKSEADLKKQAAKIFDKEDYATAYPLYSQLLSLYPKNGDYNYKFGVCILLSTGDKEKPIAYLEYASKQPDVDKDVFYYLAKAYHLNYRFDDAIAMYQKYKSVGSKSQIEKFQIDHQIEMCKNGKTLLQSISGLDVIDKKELTVDDYFLSYNLPDIGGKLLVEPDDFKTAYDKKKNVNSVIFLSKNNNQIYYSSYGKDGKNGKDIYVIRKLPSGDWSKPESLGSPINTAYDEDYPFLHPNGKELYFCSKGHNSMGGYDIFKSTWNDITHTWGAPVNLDFPINTPDDDILYITDTDEKMAYFSSNRSSPDGKITIYKINVARKPVDISIIKGAIVKTKDDQKLDSKITVQNMETNEIEGIFKGNDSTGNYFMNLPNGGKFLFTVETDGFKTQSDMVSIPVQYELKPLKQEISYKAGTEKLIIKNMFDQPVDDNNYLLAMNYIKQRAKLDVNAAADSSASKNNFSNNDSTKANSKNNAALSANTNSNQGKEITKDSLATSNNSANDTSSVVAGSTNPGDSSDVSNNNHPNLSNADIVKIAYNDAKEADKEAKDMQNQANTALSIANEKNEETKDKYSEANQLQAKADQTQDPTQKQAVLEDYNDSKKEAGKLAKETVAAFNIATKLQSDATEKRKDADFSEQYAKQLDNAVHSNSKNADDALKQLADQKDSLDKMNQQPVGTDNVYNNLKSDANDKQTAADNQNQILKNDQQQLMDLNGNINQMQAQADTSNQPLKQALQNQINELKTERKQKQNDIAVDTKKSSELQDEANDLKDQLSVSSGMINQIKQGSKNPNNADVSAIDKQKLQAEVSSYKQINPADTANSANNALTNNSTNSSDSTAQKNNFSANDSSKTISKNNFSDSLNLANKNAQNINSDSTNYADKYSKAITEADKISDDYNRDEAESAIYSDWANAIKNDISDKKENLKTIKNKKEKRAAEKTITDLQKDFFTKQNLSQQYAQKADALKQNSEIARNNNSGNTTNSGDSNTVVPKNNFSDSTNSENKNAQNKNSANQQNVGNNDLTSVSNNSTQKNNFSDSTNSKNKNAQNKNSANQQNAGNTDVANVSNNSNQKNNFSDSANSENKNVQNKISTNQQNAGNTDVANVSNNSTQKNNFSDSINSENKNAQNKISANQQNAGNTDVANVSNNSNQKNNFSDSTNSENKNAQNKNSQNNNLANTADNSAKIYSSENAANSENQAKQSEQQAADANEKYTNLMQQATSEKDAAKRTQLIADANAAQTQSQQAQLQAEDLYANANKIQNQKNNQELTQLEQATASKNADDLLIAGAMSDDATTHYNNAQNDRNLATQKSNYIEQEGYLKRAHDEENTALQKQQKAIAIYSKYAPEIAAQFDQNKNQNNASANSQNSTIASNNGQLANVAENTNSSQSNKNSTISEDSTKIKNTAEYQKYVAIINQSDSLENSATTAFSAADNYKKISATEADSATKNRAAADTINNSEQKQNTLAKAQYQVTQATINKNKSDSLTALANQNQTASISKKADAETYLNSLNKQTAENIKTISNSSKNAVNTSNSNNNLPTENTDVASDKTNNLGNNSQQNTSDNNLKSNGNEANNLSDSKNNFSNSTNTNSSNATDNVAVNSTENTTENTTTMSLTDVFEVSTTPVYSANSPIPINPKMPNGVYFKVQVGAFRNKIQQNLFKGMNPVIGETTPQGFIRYSAGMFKGIDKANDAKNKVIEMGYKDAFVVAFVNGKRVSMSEAMAALHSSVNGNNVANNSTNQASEASNPNNTATQNASNNVSENTNTSQNNVSENPSNTAISTDVVQVKGLFYTVQVGVYFKPVKASKLFNIQPLYSEKTAKGLIRYNSGIFNDFDKANSAKNKIVEIGIKDAFVTAYYNGTRIDPDKAKTLIADGKAQFTSDSNINAMPSQGVKTIVPSQQNAVQNTTTTPQKVDSTTLKNTNQTAVIATNNNATEKNNSANKVVFKVQIGAYKNKIPIAVANKFLTLGGNGVNSYVDENQNTIYTVGNFSSFNDAEQLKNNIVKAGITDAFVAAFNNGKKITLPEAQKLLQ